MKKRVLIFSAVIAVGICSCQINKQEKFIEREKAEVQKEIEDILTELGYADFSIHLYYHRSYNNREVSKSVSTNKIFGDEITIKGKGYFDYTYSELSENQEYITNGYIEDRTMAVNYDEMLSGKIFYEYISIFIIITGIEQNEVNELLKLFSNYILNNNRGDTIFIKPR
jgi:hypothetical protein